MMIIAQVILIKVVLYLPCKTNQISIKLFQFYNSLADGKIAV